MFICIFKCEDKTFYFGPFEAPSEAQAYENGAREQALRYYGKDIAKRSIKKLHLPVKK